MFDKIGALLKDNVDLVAIDVRYHASCLNACMNKRSKPGSSDSDYKDKNSVFVPLTEELYTNLIFNRSVINLFSTCDVYRTLLPKI